MIQSDEFDVLARYKSSSVSRCLVDESGQCRGSNGSFKEVVVVVRGRVGIKRTEYA